MDTEVRSEIDKAHERISKDADQNREDFQLLHKKLDEGAKDSKGMATMAAEMSVIVANNEKKIDKQEIEIKAAKKVAYENQREIAKVVPEAQKAVAEAEKNCKDNADSVVKKALDAFRKNEFKPAQVAHDKLVNRLWWFFGIAFVQGIGLIWAGAKIYAMTEILFKASGK